MLFIMVVCWTKPAITEYALVLEPHMSHRPDVSIARLTPARSMVHVKTEMLTATVKIRLSRPTGVGTYSGSWKADWQRTRLGRRRNV